MAAMNSLLEQLTQISGERIQNCQNEDEALDVTSSCARMKDKVSVIWELKPIAPRKNPYEKDEPTPRAPIRLSCVIDVSHSMEEPYGADESVSKLDKIKLFCQLLVRSMPEEDYLGIITFGTTAKTVFPLAKMTQDAKEKANVAITDISLSGVTNLEAGLIAALDMFNTPYSKSRYYNDNVIVFTDGMANEGITESDDMIMAIRKKISTLKEECHYESAYDVKFTTLGTEGFLPEMLYDIGQAFSSDAYFFLDEETNIELNLMKPVLLREMALVTDVTVKISTLNGVLLDKEQMTNEFQPYVVGGAASSKIDNSMAIYHIHDIAQDLQRHLVCLLNLPKKHKKVLKNKDIMTIEIQYRDRNLTVKSVEKTISYLDIPAKENKTAEKDILIAAEHDTRLAAQKSLNKAAELMKRLDRKHARHSLTSGCEYMREVCEYVSTMVSEESMEYIQHKVNPIIANLEHCDKIIGNLGVKWDDIWARLKAMSSSLGREVPTAYGVYAEGAELFLPPQVDDEMEDLCARLREMYLVMGYNTDTIDRYKTVMKELQDKLDKMEEEGLEVKESRI